MRQLLFIFLFIPYFSNGQHRDVSKNIITIGDSLKNIGIDTFIVYIEYCIGYEEDISVKDYDNCESKDQIFIFYKKNGSSFIQKKNECYIFKPINDSSVIFDYLIKNLNTISKEKLLMYSYVSSETGKITYTYAEHSCYNELYISVNKKIKLLNVDLNNIKQYSSSDKELNLNYQYNINSKTYKLLLLIGDYLNTQKFIKY
jgi:hypothetical protein